MVVTDGNSIEFVEIYVNYILNLNQSEMLTSHENVFHASKPSRRNKNLRPRLMDKHFFKLVLHFNGGGLTIHKKCKSKVYKFAPCYYYIF